MILSRRAFQIVDQPNGANYRFDEAAVSERLRSSKEKGRDI
jgi:hypothetical protein